MAFNADGGFQAFEMRLIHEGHGGRRIPGEDDGMLGVVYGHKFYFFFFSTIGLVDYSSWYRSFRDII